jgi:hypothetical protein
VVEQLVARRPVTLQCADIDTVGDAAISYARISARRISKRGAPCVEYIRAGDIFQVVISQRLEVPIHCASDPFEIYRTLRVVNPSPFMFFLRTGERDAGRQFAGDHVPGGGRQGHRAARWPAPAAAGSDRGGGPRWPRNCWPIPRNGPST